MAGRGLIRSSVTLGSHMPLRGYNCAPWECKFKARRDSALMHDGTRGVICLATHSLGLVYAVHNNLSEGCTLSTREHEFAKNNSATNSEDLSPW
jgi:hypothetical protein